MIANDTPRIFARASKEKPLLIVVQNRGAAATPNLVIGPDTAPRGLLLNGLLIAPGAASPQLTITEPYLIISDTPGTPQTYTVRVDNL